MKSEKFAKNDYVTVYIEDMGSDGEGIGKADGFTLFVKDAVIGDTVEAKIVKCKKQYAYARLEKVLAPSPFRVEPKCGFNRQCGGCQLQALSYEKQLQLKQEKIRNHFIRIGGFSSELIDTVMEPIVGMEEPYHYRNKAQYPVGTDKEGNIITGFYAGRTHTIIANTDCLLGVQENQAILETILKYMRENHVSAYNETTGQGLVRHILIRKGFSSGEIMVCLVINKNMTKMSYSNQEGSMDGSIEDNIEWGRKSSIKGNTECSTEDNIECTAEYSAEDKRKYQKALFCQEYLPCQKKLLSELAKIEGMTSVSVSINTEKTNVIMGKEVHTIWGSPVISDTIRVRDMQKEGAPFTGQALTFHISPLSFYQVNPVQTEKLYSLALEYAGLTGKETVWDLYCGIGTISLFLAGSAKQVYGVEIVPEAIEDARKNAVRNGISNAEFFVGKAEEVLLEFYASQIKQECQNSMLHPDVIVVDPPRKGCDTACLSTMLKMQPEKIVYVSCDSATLARDLRVLCEGGYEIKRIRGVDQFGMTVHVECVIMMQYCGKEKKK